MHVIKDAPISHVVLVLCAYCHSAEHVAFLRCSHCILDALKGDIHLMIDICADRDHPDCGVVQQDPNSLLLAGRPIGIRYGRHIHAMLRSVVRYPLDVLKIEERLSAS
jgi:hypothetical protein